MAITTLPARHNTPMYLQRSVPKTIEDAAAKATMPKNERRECQENETEPIVESTVATKPHGVNAAPSGNRPRTRRNKPANANIVTAEMTALAPPMATARGKASRNGNTKQNATEDGNATKKNNSIIVIVRETRASRLTPSVSHRRQPPVTHEYSLSKTAASRWLHALVSRPRHNYLSAYRNTPATTWN